MLSDAVHHAAPGDRIVVSAGTFQEQSAIVIDKPIEIIAANCFKGDMSALGVNNTNGGDQGANYGGDGDGDDDGDYGMYGVGADAGDDRPRAAGNALVVGESKIQIQGQKSKLIQVDISLSSTNGLEGCVTIRGLNLISGSDEQAVVSVVRGTLRLEKCEVTGGQDCISVHGAFAFCNIFNSTLHGAAHATLSFAASARGMVRNCVMTNSPTGVVVSTSGDPTITDCTVRECGTGVLVRDEGNGIFSQCIIEKNNKPGIIVSGRSNPVLRRCRISDGESNGIFVRDEGRGVFVDCEVSRNGLPAVATCNESYPVLCHCTIHEGQNAGVLIYDNGSGIISKCIIRDNHMPGIEVRAGGHPVVAGCEIFNHESNGVYVHNRGRGVFHGCRIYENVLPGVAIRTAGHPIIHGCSIVTGKDSALMVCDKGKGIILESALKGYSARPLEIRDGCSPIIQYCELHDGKHRHVMEWLQQIPKAIKPSDIEALGWSEDQLAAEDREIIESSPLAREIDETGPIVIIGEDASGQGEMKPVPIANNEKINQEPGQPIVQPIAPVVAANENIEIKLKEDAAPREPAVKAKGEEPKKVVQPTSDEPQPKKEGKKVRKENNGPLKPAKTGKKRSKKTKPEEKAKKTQDAISEDKTESGSSEEQTSSITLSTADKSAGDDKEDSIDDESSESSDPTISDGDVLSSSESSPGEDSPTKTESSHHKGHAHKRSGDKGKKKSKPKKP